MLALPLRLPAATFLVVVIGFACYRYSELAGARNMAAHLDAAHIDFACAGIPSEEALRLFHRKLADADPYFESCTFDAVQASGNTALLTLDLTAVPGTECLRYITDLSGLHYRLRPQKVVIAPSQRALRDPLERAAHATLGWLEGTWHWVAGKIGATPPAPPDPFAPLPTVP